MTVIAPLDLGDQPGGKFTIVGDSISMHQASGIWPGGRGMAASVDRLDWVNLVTSRLGAQFKIPLEDGAGATFLLVADELDTYEPSYSPDYVVIQVVEHYYSVAVGLDTDELIDAWFAKVEAYATKHGSRLIMPTYALNAISATKSDKVRAQMAGSALEGWVVDLDTRLIGVAGAYGIDPYNEPENPGVQGHPSDFGMELIADAMLHDVWGLSLYRKSRPRSTWRAL